MPPLNTHYLSTWIIVAHWLIVVGLSLRVIMQRPPVGIALAWLAVIASAPLFGAAVYLLFGEKRLGRHRAAQMAVNTGTMDKWLANLRAQYDTKSDDHSPIAAEFRPLHRHAENVPGFPLMAGNQVKLFDNFTAVFDSLISDIDAARQSCELCYYIWSEGGRANDVINALIRAAQRGVECRILADGIGSAAFLKSESAKCLRTAGVQLLTALPAGLWRTIFVRRDLRNHRKIVVIDQHLAYTGSQNLVDPRFFKETSGVGMWVDAVARITGPATVALLGVFEFDWSLETGRGYRVLPPILSVESEDSNSNNGVPIQVVPSGPSLKPDAIYQLLLTAIYTARRKLVMTTPYFVPDDAILTALLSAALRGVDVTLIVPAHNDSLLVRYASVAHFDELLSAGVHIARFEGGLLHTKSLAIDDSLSIFGSVNLDMRSLWLNFEISLFLYDRGFTSELQALQQGYLENSTLIDLPTWRQRPASRRFVENLFRLLSPLL